MSWCHTARTATGVLEDKVIRVAVALFCLQSAAWAADTISVLPDSTRCVQGHAMVKLADYKAIQPKIGMTLFGGRVKRTYPAIGWVLLDYPTAKNIPAVITWLKSRPTIRDAEPDIVYKGCDFTPNDPGWSQQWAAERIECPKAWDYCTGSSGVTIAIIDSGVHYNLPDLAANYAGGYDFQDNDTDPTEGPLDVHGTTVASVSSCVTNNNVGIAGAGFNCKFFAVRAGTIDNFPENQIISAINWSVTNGAQVINLSLGGYGFSSAMQDAINAAAAAGVVLCASAGNDHTSQLFYPAAYTNCIAVAATNSSDDIAWWSNYGSWVDIGAPGEGVSIYWQPNIGPPLYGPYGAGTSYAAPLVAATAALVYSELGGVSSPENAAIVRGAIQNTALPEAFSNPIAGGRLDTYLAVLRYADVQPIYVTSTQQTSSTGTAVEMLMAFPWSYTLFEVTGISGKTIWISKNGVGNGIQAWTFGGAGSLVKPGAIVYQAAASPGPYLYAGMGTGAGFNITRYNDHGTIDAGWTFPGTAINTAPTDLYIDGAGNLVMIGVVPTAPSGQGIWLGKVNSAGSITINGVYNSSFAVDAAKQVQIQSGNIYIFGYSGDGNVVSGANDFLLLKLRSDGVLLWERRWNNANDVGVSMAFNSTHNQMYGFGKGGLASYDTSGSLLYGLPSSGPKIPNGGVTVAPDDSAVYTTNATSTSTIIDLNLTKVTSGGSLVWSSKYSISNVGSTNLVSTRPRLDADGNIYAAMFVEYGTAGWDSIVVKFDAAGNVGWSGRYAGGFLDAELAGDLMDVSSDGTVVLPFTRNLGNNSHSRDVLGYKAAGGGNTSTGTMGGHIDLDQYSGSGGLVGEIEFRDPGSTRVLIQSNMSLAPDGSYSLPNVPTGAYDVSVKFPNWLRKTVHDAIMTKQGLELDISLINGDGDGDNAVTVSDLNSELINFATNGAEGGDLDWDGIVGLPDINIVFTNFAIVGDA